MSTTVAWFASMAGDVGLLANEFLPELLLVSLLLLVSWGIRRGFRRDARSSL